MRANHYTPHLDGTVLIPLPRLVQGLRTANLGVHRWAVRSLQRCFYSPTDGYSALVIIGYSNPNSSLNPKMISIALPLVALLTGAHRKTDWIVCLSRTWFVPVGTGRGLSENAQCDSADDDIDLVWGVLVGLFRDKDSRLPADFLRDVEFGVQPTGPHNGRAQAKAVSEYLDSLLRNPELVFRAIVKSNGYRRMILEAELSIHNSCSGDGDSPSGGGGW
jgi:hypothetical protein